MNAKCQMVCKAILMTPCLEFDRSPSKHLSNLHSRYLGPDWFQPITTLRSLEFNKYRQYVRNSRMTRRTLSYITSPSRLVYVPVLSDRARSILILLSLQNAQVLMLDSTPSSCMKAGSAISNELLEAYASFSVIVSLSSTTYRKPLGSKLKRNDEYHSAWLAF